MNALKPSENWRLTMAACFIGSASQAAVNNYAPLLFLTFRSTFGLSLGQVTLLVTFNFLIQLLVDLLSAGVADKIGYRPCLAAAQFLSAAGLAGLGIFPFWLPPFWGLLLAVFLYAIGGGLVEVLVSPVMEGCPTERKDAAMSLLHSFYCWGVMAVILLSTGFFALFGIKSWPAVAVFWSVLPFVNGFLFLRVPIRPPVAPEESHSIAALLKKSLFWLFVLLMFASGAAELSMSQWASAFVESGLRVPKALGDLLGPCLFAGCMGLSRLLFAKKSASLPLKRFMLAGGGLCLVTYLVTALSPLPALALFTCAATGFGVGVLWPGTFSLASAAIPKGGTALFALLALAGDLGGTTGPTLVGFVSARCGGSLRAGLLAALVFPVLLLAGLLPLILKKKGGRTDGEFR